MMLDPKPEAVAVGLAAGMTQSAAYRKAFPNSLKWKDKTVWEWASRLASESKVRARVEELRAATAEASLLTLKDHAAELARLRDVAESANQLSAAITAEVSRGKACGLYTEKVQHSVDEGSASAVARAMAALFEPPAVGGTD